MITFFGIGPALSAIIGAVVYYHSAKSGRDGDAASLRVRLLNGAFAGFVSVIAVAVLYLGLIWKLVIGDAVGDGEAACFGCFLCIVLPVSYLTGFVFGAGLGQSVRRRE